MKKRLTSLIIVCVMALQILPVMVGTPAEATGTDIQIGDYVSMGSYQGEDILWRCVDIDEHGPLMMSDKILCLKAFDAKSDENTGGSHARRTPRYDYDGDSVMFGSNYWGDSNIR